MNKAFKRKPSFIMQFRLDIAKTVRKMHVQFANELFKDFAWELVNHE